MDPDPGAVLGAGPRRCRLWRRGAGGGGPGGRLALLRRGRGRPAPFPADADRPDERREPRGRLDLSHGRSDRRLAGRDREAGLGPRVDELPEHADPRRPHALPLHALQPRDRPRPGDGRGALDLRSEGRHRGALPAQLPRRLVLEGRTGRRGRPLPEAHHHGHGRRAPDRVGRRDRASLHQLRSRRRRRPARGRRRPQAWGIRRHLAAGRPARPDHHGLDGARQPARRRALRRRARLLGANGRAALGLERAAARRAHRPGRPLPPGHRQRLVRALGRQRP